MTVTPDQYCRDVEAYLCRKNDGHLVRIVGPAFEQVSRWATMGVPITVAYLGIDRSFERYYRRGPRRRPVRIEFCEADVLDAFDDWRRAVGVVQPPPHPPEHGEAQGALSEAAPRRRKTTLASHVERAIARLTLVRGSTHAAGALGEALAHAIEALDALQPGARQARGEARAALVLQLLLIDQSLMAAAAEAADESVRAAAEAESREALGPFRDRMAPDAYQRSRRAAIERHLRAHFGLPAIAFD